MGKKSRKQKRKAKLAKRLAEVKSVMACTHALSEAIRDEIGGHYYWEPTAEIVRFEPIGKISDWRYDPSRFAD